MASGEWAIVGAGVAIGVGVGAGLFFGLKNIEEGLKNIGIQERDIDVEIGKIGMKIRKKDKKDSPAKKIDPGEACERCRTCNVRRPTSNWTTAWQQLGK